MNFSRIIMFCLSLSIVSCRLVIEEKVIDLGGNYKYIDSEAATILYSPTKEYNGVGTNIVPPRVINYAFNERYIIARTQHANSEKSDFWIIDKQKKGSNVNNLDSIIFYDMLAKNEISLSF